jgi:single-strand DNA-binding protein
MSNIFSGVVTLGRDAEVRVLGGGTSVLTFTAASNTGYGDKQKTLWIRVQIFGKRAEGQLVDYLKKGVQCFVSGELSMNEYQAQDGTTRQTLDLNANIVDLVGGKREGNNQSQGQQRPQQQRQPAQQNRQSAQDYDDGLDIPF